MVRGLLEAPIGRVLIRVGGWGENSRRPRVRLRSADCRLGVLVAIGSIIGSYEQSCKSVCEAPGQRPSA